MANRPILLLRIGVPAIITVAGIVLLTSSNDVKQGAGVALIGVAIVVALLNFFFVMSARDCEDREREEAARAWFSEHGRWPEE